MPLKGYLTGEAPHYAQIVNRSSQSSIPLLRNTALQPSVDIQVNVEEEFSQAGGREGEVGKGDQPHRRRMM